MGQIVPKLLITLSNGASELEFTRMCKEAEWGSSLRT